MKVSTKGRYALEAIVDLAINSSDGHESLKSIAERRGFSENYLEQIFVLLRKKNIVESIRGAQGGYKLSKDASQITAGDIIRATEGEVSVVPCVKTSAMKSSKNQCDMFDMCVTKIFWGKLTEKIEEMADSVSVADLVKAYKDMQAGPEIEYYI